jgi:hypothetical protein
MMAADQRGGLCLEIRINALLGRRQCFPLQKRYGLGEIEIELSPSA